MKKLLKPLCRTLTASSIALALHPSAFAAIVRSDVDYQIFRDFAENKGKFHVGATNVEIRDKNGNALGTLLPNLPMIDFSPVDVQMRVATLVDPQYVVSVKHNSGYKNVRFGIKTGHSDIPDDTYRLVDRNNDGPPDIWWKYDRRHEDYHSPRLHRFVTEVVPMPTTTAGTDPNTYMDTARFPYILRVGAGTQFRESANKDREELQGAYNYAIGGQSYDLQPKKQGFLDLYGNLFDKPLTNYAVPGDSGSPIFTFDKQQNKWVFLGTYTYWGGYTNTTWQEYIIYRNDFNQQRYAEDIAGQITADDNEEFIWEATDKTSTIRSTRNNNKTLVVDLIDASLKTAEEQLNYGKTAYLNGNNGLLKLQGDINQGAGGLYFNGNYTVSGKNANTTWTGAGISVAEEKQVNWQIRNNDILSKIGSGTLHVNGTGKNDGKISVGDGTVILNQTADENGNKQAFKEVGIVSGRPTVILNDAEQVNPDRIYFGFRGGRLDLNGNNLTFKRIRNVDEGAMIVNHNANQASTLTLTGQNLFLPEQVTIREVHNSNRPAGYHLYHWQNGCENRYFVSKHDNMKASFPCKPGQGSTDDWEIVATDREEAINIVTQREIQRKDVTINAFDGYLGETNAALHNGKLNVNINAVNNQSTFLFTGGSQLNGDVTLNQGIAMFSGRPVPHANDYLNGNKGKDVVFDDEWINRTFNANNINVNNNSVFYSSRNVAQVNANFNASQNGQIHLGYKSGDPVCIRSDYTGKVTCSNEVISAKALNSFTATEIRGNTQLTDHAQLILGKAHLFGTINGTGNSLVRLTENANWTLTGDSQTARLNLEKSHIFLNSQENPTVYNHLTINALNGEGTFHYASALTNQRGDKVTVTNQASGNFVLDVKDSGGEAKYEKLDLLDASKATRDPALKVSLARNHVDLGAYVYSLIEQDGIFRLYNAKLENEKIEAERIAKEKEEARLAEEARQRELARLEAERIAKEKAEQARLEAERIAKEKEEARLAEEARQRELARLEAERIAKEKAEQARLEAERIAKAKEEVRLAEEARQRELARLEAERIAKEKAEQARLEAERIAKEKEEARLAEEARQRELARLEAERIAKEKEEQARLEAERIAKEKEDARLAEEARQRNATTKPVTYKQKEIISANTNAVLSDTAMLTALNLELASRLDRTILTQRSGMWLSHNNSEHKYHSDDYKNFHSKSNQVALGAETPEMANGVVLGAMVTHAQTNNEFSSLSGKNTLSLATLYAKQQIDQFSWAIDTSYGWSRSKIDGEHKFDRNIVNVGLNMAYDVMINGLQITPMLGVRYHQISSSEGELNGVIVKNPVIKLPTYHTGVKVGYHFNVNGWEITPEISTYYVSTGNKSYSQRINEQEFEQTFGHYTYHEANLSFGYKPWKVSMYAGNTRGKNKEKQNQFGVKLNYSW
ncbi:S6 family peptidase [Aggregatibacter segnis]|uniref:S6 family peptidase n=1 Tax=Aggregatibacter segnis TaxID=739 RepID=UPI0028E537F4|nr:S6 family peptidase [Aggregatibacter segnis]